MPVYGPNLDITSNFLWDFHLIADVRGEKAKKRCFSAHQYISLDLISDQGQSDRIRMLLQAACLARLGNAQRVRLSFRRYTPTTPSMRNGTSCTSLMCRMLL